jgi:drug/metabolite transporter (DMT)-like permease
VPSLAPSEPRGPERRPPAVDLGMLLVVLIWGANFSVVKAAFSQIPPLPFVALRFGLGSLCLAAILRWREAPLRLPREHWRRLVWLGLVGNTLYQTLFVCGLARTTAANSALLLATTPAVVALLGGLTGVERVTRRAGGGVALALGGITLVMAARGAALSRQTLAGDLLTLAGVVCWSAYVLGVRSLATRLSPLRVTALSLFTGTPGLLLVGLPGLANLEWGAVGGRAWLGLAYATLPSLVLSYLLYNRSVQRLGGVQATVYTCATPLVASLAAWAILGERPVPLQAAGAALIIAGVLLTRDRDTRTEHG